MARGFGPFRLRNYGFVYKNSQTIEPVEILDSRWTRARVEERNIHALSFSIFLTSFFILVPLLYATTLNEIIFIVLDKKNKENITFYSFG
jgi:hypothetical protein